MSAGSHIQPSSVQEYRSRVHFSHVRCPALRTAVREICAEWSSSWAAEGSPLPLDSVLTRLARRVDQATKSTRVKEKQIDGGQDTASALIEMRLLGALRVSLLRQWRRRQKGVDQARVLSLLSSIEQLTGEAVEREAEGSEAETAEAEAFRLVAHVAHDLRSPLTSILFLSEALRNGQSGYLSEVQRHQIGLIYSAALGLTGVTNDLMTLAQQQACGFSEDEVAFSVPETFDAVREMVAPMAEVKGINVRFAVHCFGHRVGHPGPLGRVLLNLTTNALKFTDEGGTVEVLADSTARDMVEVSVQDTGRGITPERLAELFRPFQKSSGSERDFFASSGLGLTIVRRLLEQMNSELTIDTEVGRGTRFSFVLRLPTSR